ncbi:MAG: hypothetical protein PHH77_11720 [Victivallaceae bacterium]|nr:hypothetical protein [Victivallaceae bacterium]
MNAKRKRKNAAGSTGTVVLIIVLPLLLANIWAGWKILRMAECLKLPLLGAVNDGPLQLGGLLLANCIALTLLAIINGK